MFGREKRLERRLEKLELQLAEALATITELRKENEKLRVQLGKHSQNSSRPPSSDPPSAPSGRGSGRDKKKRKKKKRRTRGGQAGHQRHERALVPVGQVDEVVEVKPAQCGGCGSKLRGSDKTPRRHQVTEVPRMEPTVTEYRLHKLECRCGVTTCAAVPAGVPSGAFGPRLTALVAVTSSLYRLPKRMIVEFLSDVCGVTISLGAISKLEQRTCAALAQPVTEAHKHVKTSRVVYADETGWREAKRKAWMWMAATAHVAVFLIRPRRAMEIAKELLGAAFAGFLVTDRYASYGFVDPKCRQVCWAHILRDVEAFRAWGTSGNRLATQLQRAARKLIHYSHRVRDGTLTRRGFRRKAKPLRLQVLRQLRKGACWWATPEISGVCEQILKLKAALFAFVDHEGIEPTNNHSERLLRHAVIWRKISFGTDSKNGSRFVERMLTTVMTLRLQKRNVLDYLARACDAALNQRSAPSLLPPPVDNQAIAA
ncbi:MAG: IS66 family transposase [Pirellulaceae bacterium]